MNDNFKDFRDIDGIGSPSKESRDTERMRFEKDSKDILEPAYDGLKPVREDDSSDDVDDLLRELLKAISHGDDKVNADKFNPISASICGAFAKHIGQHNADKGYTVGDDYAEKTTIEDDGTHTYACFYRLGGNEDWAFELTVSANAETSEMDIKGEGMYNNEAHDANCKELADSLMPYILEAQENLGLDKK